MYTDLSDFISRTWVSIDIATEKAVVIVGQYKDTPVRIYGFETDPELSDFEIKELAYLHFKEHIEV